MRIEYASVGLEMNFPGTPAFSELGQSDEVALAPVSAP
jgi:hypothetical protein